MPIFTDASQHPDQKQKIRLSQPVIREALDHFAEVDIHKTGRVQYGEEIVESL